MSPHSRQFRVFVSSTFSDFIAERDALRERVFPRLIDLCWAYGASFQAVDLRWGVSEEAAQDQQTMRICLGEIDRCRQVTARPNFIVLLGDRYGWRPLPELIPGSEYERISTLFGETHPPGLALLERWYRRDDNAVPSAYRLLPREDEFDHYDDWQAVEHRLSAMLCRAAEALPFTFEQRLKYVASATEQEMAHHGLLDGTSDTDAALCLLRRIDGLPAGPAARAFRDLNAEGRPDVDARQRLDHVKKRLRERDSQNLFDYRATWQDNGITTDHIDRLCEDVYSHLERIIQEELEARQAIEPLTSEIAAHESFAEVRQRIFVGRVEALHAIMAYVNGPSGQPLIVHGPSGSGKTTLMARAAAEIRRQQPQAEVITRFIGATPESSGIRALLQGLCDELARRYEMDDEQTPTAYDELVPEFSRRLAFASPERPLVVLVDALDQLAATREALALMWLPAELPPGVRLVISTLPDTWLTAVRQKVPNALQYPLQPMRQDEGGILLDAWFREVGRTLRPHQRERVLEAFAANGLPLYLRLVFERVRWLPSDVTEIDLAADVPGIIQQLCRHLSEDSRHGATLVSHSLAYLAAGKNGLTQEELLDVLSSDAEVMQDFRARSVQPLPEQSPLPAVIWSRLYFDLAPYLTERTADGMVTLDFYHRQLRQVIEQDYLSVAVRRQRHAHLADYFRQQAYETGATMGRTTPNLRMLSEWPYQLAHGERWRELDDALTDYNFLRVKVEAVGPQPMIDDFALCQIPGTSSTMAAELGGLSHLESIEEALRLAANVIDSDASQLPSQLIGRLCEVAELGRFLHQVRQQPRLPWLCPRTTSLTPPGGPLIHAVALNSPIGALAVIGDAAVLCGCEDGTLRIVELEEMLETRRIAAHRHAVTAICVTPDGKRALSGAADGSMAYWRLQGEPTHTVFDGHGEQIGQLRLTSDGTSVLSASRDRRFRLRALSDGKMLFDLPLDGWVSDLALLPGDRRLVIASGDYLSLYDLDQARELQSFQGDDGGMLAVALTPDGRYALAASGDISTARFNLRLWDLEQWQEVARYETRRWQSERPGHTSMIDAVAVTPDGRRAVTGSHDYSVRLWNLWPLRQMACYRGHEQPVKAVAVLPGGHAAVSIAGNTLHCWRLQDGGGPRLSGHAESVYRLTVSRDGARAVTLGEDNSFYLWDLEQNRLLARLENGLDRIGAFAFMSNGREALCCTRPPASPGGVKSRLVIIDFERGEVVRQVTELDETPSAMVLTPDERQVLIGSRTGSVMLMDVERGEVMQAFQIHHDGVTGLAVIEDQRLALSASDDFSLRLWELDSGRERQRLDNSSGAPAMAATPDGRRAVSGTHFGRLNVWDLETCEMIASLPHAEIGQNSSVMAVAITPDGSKALSGANDRLIRLWDLDSERCLSTFVAEHDTHAACAAGKHLFIAGSRSGGVHILEVRGEGA